MKQINLKLPAEQIDHLATVGNKSEYIRNLIQSDMHKETRYEYIWPIISKYTLNSVQTGNNLGLIADLSMMLARSISGEDIITELMEGGSK